MDEDFNFAGGLAVLFAMAKKLQREANVLVHEGKTETDPVELRQQWETLVELAGVLGFTAEPEEEVEESSGGLQDEEIEALIQERAKARKEKNFQESDRIRDQLQAEGIILIDRPGGVTSWHR